MPARSIVGTLDATDTDSTVSLGAGSSGELGSIVFQVTGTIGGAFSGIVRATLTDPASSPTWFTVGFVKMDAPDTVVTALTTVGVYKVFSEAYTAIQLKTNVAGTGSLPIYSHAVKG